VRGGRGIGIFQGSRGFARYNNLTLFPITQSRRQAMSEPVAAPAAAPEPLFALSKTRVCVYPGELQRKNEDGTLLLRLPLASIQSAVFRRPFNPSCLLLVGAAALFAAIGWFVSEYNWLSCLLYVAAVVVTVVAVIGSRSDRLVLRTDGGEVSFDCAELANEVTCFVTSLQEVLATSRR
jgi:hypothetical protein